MKPPLRICLIIPTLDRHGAEKQLCLLAAGLPRDRFDVHVIALTRTGPRATELATAGIPVHLVGKSRKLSPLSLLRLTRLLKLLRPDLVHTWIFAANCYGRVAARWAKVPQIVAGERCVDLWKTQRHLLIDRRLSKFTRCIITNSTGVVQFYVERGLPADLFRVIPNGIAPAAPSGITRHEAMQRMGIPDDRKVIGAVGRLWPQKRYRDLICAVDLLGVIQPQVTLAIIGDGPQRDELLRYRDQVTDPQWVRFVGDRDDVPDLLPHLDAFWLGSAYEGQSNALLEAMQAGRPVVVSDIPGNRDLVEHEVSGLVLPLGDTGAFAKQTHRLLSDPDLANRLGQAAANRIASEFTVEKMISRHASLYESLCGRSNA